MDILTVVYISLCITYLCNKKCYTEIYVVCVPWPLLTIALLTTKMEII